MILRDIKAKKVILTAAYIVPFLLSTILVIRESFNEYNKQT